MTRPKDAKVWNEDLVLALQAREQMARRAEKRSHLLWREGWHAIQAVRGDIYAFKNGRIVHLPDKLKTTVANLCRNIIAGTEPVFPPEYVPYDPHQQQQQQHGGSRGGGGNGENPYLKDPYLNSIKKRGGAFAILMAFHTSPYDQVLTKDQICAAAQPFCDTEMTENYMAGRARGAWSGIKTLQAHDLVMVQQRAIGYNDRAGGLRSLGKNSYMLTPNGRLFITALLQKNPDLQREQRNGSVGRASTHQNHNHDIVGIHSFQDYHHHHHHDDDASIQSATGITDLWQDPFSSRNSVPHGFPMKSSPPRTYSTLSGSTGGGHVLKNQSPTAKRRLNFVSSREAAANAALERQAIEESIRMAQGMANPKSSARLKEGTNSIPPSKKLVPQPSPPIMIDLTQQQNYPYGMVEEGERKLPAVMVVNPYLSARMKSSSRAVVVPVVLDLDSDDSDDDDDDILNYRSSTLTSSSTATMTRPTSSTVPRSTNVQRNNYPARQLPVVAIADDDVILDLTDSQPTPIFDDDSEYQNDEQIITPAEDGKPAAAASDSVAFKSRMVEPSSNNCNRRNDTTTSNNLAIYIDDRERNRNRTPRTLRMELSRLLSTTTGIGGGIFSLVWPHKVPPPIVEERRLPIGDFAFHRIVSSSTSTEQNTTIALPISLERKRIGDLVGRSAHKDHWYQWQRMQDEAIHRGDSNGICIMLLEGDPRTTVQFVPYGAQQEAETFSPFVHTIDDEETFYRYMCRTIINDRAQTTRFIQTKDEQGTLRMVGVLGLMSITNDRLLPAKTVSTQRRSSMEERLCLQRRLQNCGIPKVFVTRIADEIRSVQQMDLLYSSIDDTICRELVLVPLISDLCDSSGWPGTPSAWSTTIHRAWFSKLSNPILANERFAQLRHLVEDHALLLDKLHTGLSSDAAVDEVLGSHDLLHDTGMERYVLIDLPTEYVPCFSLPENENTTASSSFFRLRVVDTPTTIQSIPSCIVMQACAGPYHSSRLFIFLIDGAEFIRRIQDVVTTASAVNPNYVHIARTCAQSIRNDFSTPVTSIPSNDERSITILLIRAMDCALSNAAKKNGFRSEIRVVADMVQAELMMEYQTVVLHAVRLNSGEREMILRQMALACYHYQLLTYKTP